LQNKNNRITFVQTLKRNEMKQYHCSLHAQVSNCKWRKKDKATCKECGYLITVNTIEDEPDKNSVRVNAGQD